MHAQEHTAPRLVCSTGTLHRTRSTMLERLAELSAGQHGWHALYILHRAWREVK